jgi:hypothetical protein
VAGLLGKLLTVDGEGMGGRRRVQVAGRQRLGYVRALPELRRYLQEIASAGRHRLVSYDVVYCLRSYGHRISTLDRYSVGDIDPVNGAPH